MLALIDESTCKLGASLSVVEENHFADLVVVWHYFLCLLFHIVNNLEPLFYLVIDLLYYFQQSRLKGRSKKSKERGGGIPVSLNLM